MIPRVAVALGLVLVTIFLPAHARAEEWIKQGEERFLISGGYFLPLFSTNLRVDNETLGEGASINLEDDLGLSRDASTGWLGAKWRFARRHKVAVSYFRFVREADQAAEREITIGDEIFPIGANLSTRFAIQSVPFSYVYSFVLRENMEIAGTLGLHWYVNDIRVDGSASLGDLDADATAGGKVQAPLPLLGFIFDYHAGLRWAAGAQAQFLVLNIDDDVLEYSGSFIDLSGRVHYWFYNRLGVGGAFDWFSIDMDVNGEKWQGAIDYDYLGPQIYLLTRF